MILLGVELYKSDTYIERRLSATNLSSDNNLLTFRLNVPVVIMINTIVCYHCHFLSSSPVSQSARHRPQS